MATQSTPARRTATLLQSRAAWLLALLLLSGCGRTWQATVLRPDGSAFRVDRAALDRLATSSEDGEQKPVPVDRVLYAAGHRAVERLYVVASDGSRREFDWAAVADDAVWLEDGRLSIGGEELEATQLEVQPPALLSQVQADITDIAPTAAAALGLEPPDHATGQTLVDAQADHVLLLFLDGLGYQRFVRAREEGLVPTLAGWPEPLVGLTVYPPVTSVATAALLTGAPPDVNGVDERGIRKTGVQTLLDAVASAGRRTIAVEGSNLAFNLPNAEIRLSGDRDGNGSTDDNVLANALSALDQGMPDLLFVHFHGIDDAGHTYGPASPEEAAEIRVVDAALGQILERLPSGTLVIAFADHGMHPVDDDSEKGDHGRLTASNVFIPIWAMVK
jgi:hypothetical protein